MQNHNLRSFKFRQVLFRFQCNILCENCEINEFETVAVEMKSKVFPQLQGGNFFFSVKRWLLQTCTLGPLNSRKLRFSTCGAWLNSKGLQYTSTYISLSQITSHQNKLLGYKEARLYMLNMIHVISVISKLFRKDRRKSSFGECKLRTWFCTLFEVL